LPTRDQVHRFLRRLYHHWRLLWDAEARLAPKAVANSVPKAGSHLLARCLVLMGMVNSRQHAHYLHSKQHIARAFSRLKPGEFLTAHLPYSEFVKQLMEQTSARMVLIIRDPRDVVVSHFHYVTYKDPHHRLRSYYRNLPSDAERLLTSIRGIKPPPGQEHLYLPDIRQRFRGLLTWRDHGAYLVRFEDLVGPQGGGRREKQLEEITHIARHIGWPLTSSQVEEIAQRLFYTGSATFRKGTIGDWRNYFKDVHKQVFKEIAGDLLVELGYENHQDW